MNELKISENRKLKNNSPFVIPKLNTSKIGENANSEGSSSFFIPKLSFSATEINSDPIPKKLSMPKLKNSLSNSDTSAEYSNLSELVSDHLSPFKINKSSKCTVDTENSNRAKSEALKFYQKLPAYKSDSNTFSKPLATNIQRNVLNKNYKENIADNAWNIDLSVALKEVDTAPCIKKSKQVEQFDMPFIDCEVESQRYSSTECKMDISSVIHQYHQLKKSPSKFGKILGLRYKRRTTYRVKCKISSKQQVHYSTLILLHLMILYGFI